MKNFDLNGFGVQEMDARSMEGTNGGWSLFGSERSGERCWSDGECCGIYYYERKYVMGICISEGWVSETLACN